MIEIRATIDRINTLLDCNTAGSVTYAALEARLVLERVCYDRLRQSHDYISHAQLKRWQPNAIMTTLINQVDETATTTRILYISKEPAEPEVIPSDDDFVEVGIQIGFDPKYIGKLWSALSGLALHAKLPEHREDAIDSYGDTEKIRAKIVEVVSELERLSKTTLTMSGIGEEVSFACACGEKNKRRAGLLKQGQSVYCINPNCDHSYTVEKSDEGFNFEPEIISVDCNNCGMTNAAPRRTLQKMKTDQHISFSCHKCKEINVVQWRLCQVAPLAQS